MSERVFERANHQARSSLDWRTAAGPDVSHLANGAPVSEILEVDLLAFERGDGTQRRAVVDGVRRSLETGFVYTRHDLSEDLLDTAYAMSREFFTAAARGQAALDRRPAPTARPGTPGVLVETAASSDEAGLEGDAQLVGADRPPATR